MTGPLDRITALQKALDELHSAETQLGGIPGWMDELHGEHSIAKAEIDELEEVVNGARHERQEAETVVADSQEKLKHFQDQVSMVRNQREYGALLQEIDQVKDQIRRSEEEGLAALERQEEAQQPLAERHEDFSDLDGRYKEALEKWEAEKPAVAERAKRLEATIKELREQLPANILLRFDRIRERYGGRAMAEVRGLERSRQPKIWHCAACNYRVRPHVVMQILNDGTIVLCDSCKRILYLEPLQPENLEPELPGE
jgi:predicted  nucleic acid-binding Zn-ribbon protein